MHTNDNSLLLTFEFGSPGWFSVFGPMAMAQARLTPDTAVSTACEVYSNAPSHLAPTTGELAWTRRTGTGGDSFHLTECNDDEADFKIHGDYRVMRDLVKFLITEQTALEFEEKVQNALTHGDIRVIVDRRTPRENPDLSFHNLIAKITA